MRFVSSLPTTSIRQNNPPPPFVNPDRDSTQHFYATPLPARPRRSPRPHAHPPPPIAECVRAAVDVRLPPMLPSTLEILLGLVLLTAGAEALVRGSSSLGLRLGISPFLVGLIVVGFGTSTPELGASVAAALQGSPDIPIGNVVGSNILNIALILGCTALVRPIPVNLRAIRAELGWSTLAGAAPWLALLFAGLIARPLAAGLLLALAVFIARAYRLGRARPTAPEPTMEAELAVLAADTPGIANRPRLGLSIALSIAGLVLLVLGARFLVNGAVDIARTYGVSELIIGLTIIAIGTSLPELVTSLLAALKGKADLALGNVLGSNVFNMLCILPIASLILPQRATGQVVILDTPVLLVMGVILAASCATVKRISRLEGALLLLAYTAYLIVLLTLAPTWFAPVATP